MDARGKSDGAKQLASAETATKSRKRVLLAMDLSQSLERRAGVAKYAREANWILDSRLAAFLTQGRQREYLATTPADGVISMMMKHQPAFRDIVASVSVPVVDLWHDFPELTRPRVLLDQRAIGRAGAEHLLDRGLRKLVFYSHTVDARVARVRQEGFAEAAGERGRLVHTLWWDPDAPLPEGKNRFDWLGGLLLQIGVPVGVMAVNDAVASDLIEAAAHVGLRVPEDVAVIGVDTAPILCELGTVPLSSVNNARDRAGYEAAALLDRLMNGTVPPTEPLLIQPSGVVTRRSTEVIAVDEPNVGKAAQFIRDHFREPISVTDVVAASFLSRRRLQDLFLEAIGHSMSDEILRQRVAFSQQLLINTTHKIDQVGRLSGFGGGMRMSKVYQRKLGMSPQQYRQMYRPSTVFPGEVIE